MKYTTFTAGVIVAAEDISEKVTWDEAMHELVDGWRLPTKSELALLYKQRKEIGGFDRASYWSSSKYDDHFAWTQSFNSGHQNYYSTSSTCLVRAVRDEY